MLRFIEKLCNTESDNSKNERLFNYIKGIENSSSRISTWNLSILGGSLLAITHSDFQRPEIEPFRIIYLLFILGWIFIGIAFFNGKKITSLSIGSDMHKADVKALTTILEQCNSYYSKQLSSFNLGLLVFGVWLLLYLILWLFGKLIFDFQF